MADVGFGARRARAWRRRTPVKGMVRRRLRTDLGACEACWRDLANPLEQSTARASRRPIGERVVCIVLDPSAGQVAVSAPRPRVHESPDGIEVETGPSPATSVVWLHGLGADGSDFVPLVPALGLRTPVRFVFPHAPRRAVTINSGMVMRAWYDVLALDGPRREDEAGIRESARLVEGLIAAEVARGVAPDRVILAGFSQGGAMTLHVGLRHPVRLGGLLVLSAYLPLAGTIAGEVSAAGRGTPVFIGHGTADPLIPPARARSARDAVEALGCPVEYHEYPIAHTVSDAEVRDLAAWLGRRVSAA